MLLRLSLLGILVLLLAGSFASFLRNRGANHKNMDATKWFDGYSGQSTNELISLQREYRTDSIVLAFEQAIQQKAARKGESSLTTDERMVLAIEALEREVNNGGYSLFFLNSSHEYLPTIVQSLQQIGCPRRAEITQAAIDALHLHDLSDPQIESEMKRDDDQRDAALDRCDKRYFKEPEAIADHLFGYIKAHPDSFPL